MTGASHQWHGLPTIEVGVDAGNTNSSYFGMGTNDGWRNTMANGEAKGTHIPAGSWHHLVVIANTKASIVETFVDELPVDSMPYGFNTV